VTINLNFKSLAEEKVDMARPTSISAFGQLKGIGFN